MKNWQKILLLAISLLIIIILIFIFPKKNIEINLILLTITFFVLVWYAYDTHRIANQTVENSLRPLILRSGFIDGWKSISFKKKKNNSIDGKPLEFRILKNIVKDINGYIILNNKKYELLFGSNISSISNNQNLYTPQWGWMENNFTINAIFDCKKYKEIKEKNQIYLKYKDIEGNEYFTKEDEKFSQVSGKL